MKSPGTRILSCGCRGCSKGLGNCPNWQALFKPCLPPSPDLPMQILHPRGLPTLMAAS